MTVGGQDSCVFALQQLLGGSCGAGKPVKQLACGMYASVGEL
jgi:hypothetical protein